MQMGGKGFIKRVESKGFCNGLSEGKGGVKGDVQDSGLSKWAACILWYG
jgi:hypothetical protein